MILVFYREDWSQSVRTSWPFTRNCSYQVYRSQDGTTERALYVIDADGIVGWSYVSPVGVNPGADGILRALDSLDASNS